MYKTTGVILVDHQEVIIRVGRKTEVFDLVLPTEVYEIILSTKRKFADIDNWTIVSRGFEEDEWPYHNLTLSEEQNLLLKGLLSDTMGL